MGTRQEIGIFILILGILAIQCADRFDFASAHRTNQKEPDRAESMMCPDHIRSVSATHCVLLGLAIPINRAAAVDLQLVPGIGSVLANRIITWRDQHGGFASLDEMEEVSGLGPRRLAVLRQYVAVQAYLGPTP